MSLNNELIKAGRLSIIRLLLAIFIIVGLDFSLQSQVKLDTIHWSSTYQLRWMDFQATNTDESNHDAFSSISVEYYPTKINSEKIYKLSVVCYFNRKESFTRSMGSILLSHEQGHFDIAKIFSKVLESKFDEFLKLNSFLTYNQIDSIYKSIEVLWDEYDLKYDNETNYSRNSEQQKKWTKKIKAELCERCHICEPKILKR
ncbi:MULTISPECIES: hypothetical protein [unclassified Paraflavitalea]|jgi:hypothetical protein|uniref:hypothetical protein n=1 Tax=unclassified Paraflavitalea TaxID=2798305 RepID=UPI003D343BB8